MLNKDTLKTNNVRLSTIKAKLESLPEQKTVSPDFSDGNVIVEPSEGKLLTSVTIEKPETLTPDNIKLGTEIAGIFGTGGARVAIGSFTPTEYDLFNNPISITGLGFKPKYVCIRASATGSSNANSSSVGYLQMIEGGVSSGFILHHNTRIYTSEATVAPTLISSNSFILEMDTDGFTLMAPYLPHLALDRQLRTCKYNYIAIG